MTSLAEHQSIMLNLLKGRAQPDIEDPYLAELADSDGLKLMREIALWWRALAVEESCVWTARLLKKLGLFEQYIEKFYRTQNVSPYVEKAAAQFLSQMREHVDPLIAAMARFDQVLVAMRPGDERQCIVEWDRNPDRVFEALSSGGELPAAEPQQSYQLHVSSCWVGPV